MKEKISKIFDKMNEDNVSEFSAQCSYYMILAFVPFLILLITLIQYTGVKPENIYNIINEIIPSTMNEVVIGIVQEVYSKSFGTISISIIFTLWSAGKGLYALIKGLDSIYEIKEGKYIYLKAKSILNTIIFLILIIIGLILSVFGNSILDIVRQKLQITNGIVTNIISQISIFLFTFLMFIGIYKFIPRHKVSFKSQIPGSIIGAIGLFIVSFIFSKYLDIFKGFSLMYGSLTAIMLIMMWTYTCIYTLFLGAEINKLIELLKN